MAQAAQGWKSYKKRATAKLLSVLKEKISSCTTDAMTGGSQDRNRQPGTHKVHDSCVGHLPFCGESGSNVPKEMLTFTVDSTVRRTHKRSKISSTFCACLFVLDLLRSCGGFQDRANRSVDVWRGVRVYNLNIQQHISLTVPPAPLTARSQTRPPSPLPPVPELRTTGSVVTCP